MFTPLHDRILVRRVEAGDKTPGGIFIPDNAKEAMSEGEIVSVGKGKILENGNVRPLEVKAGDFVLFGKYSGTEVEVDGEKLLTMREEELFGIVVKTKKLTGVR